MRGVELEHHAAQLTKERLDKFLELYGIPVGDVRLEHAQADLPKLMKLVASYEEFAKSRHYSDISVASFLEAYDALFEKDG